MIQIERVRKVYPDGTEALRRVDLRVARGQIVTLLGLSGAGKSTLLRCVNGLVRPTDGRVIVDGLHLDARGIDLRGIRRRIGMIFQEFNLVNRLTVLENVLTGRLAHRPTLPTLFRRFPREDYQLASGCLERVGLADRRMQRADALSGGQRQRVAIARVLAQQPVVLLADEPVASLDPRIAASVLELLRRISREDQLTVLMSLHQVSLAKAYSDRIVGIAQGSVVFDGPPEAVEGPVLEAVYGRDGRGNDGIGERVPVLAHA